jgi:hypothetical protein
VAAVFVYLQFVGVALHRKRSMKGRLTTKKTGTTPAPLCARACRRCVGAVHLLTCAIVTVTWSKPVNLDDVKLIKNTFGVTVNDVLVAALTAAFRYARLCILTLHD